MNWVSTILKIWFIKDKNTSCTVVGSLFFSQIPQNVHKMFLQLSVTLNVWMARILKAQRIVVMGPYFPFLLIWPYWSCTNLNLYIYDASPWLDHPTLRGMPEPSYDRKELLQTLSFSASWSMLLCLWWCVMNNPISKITHHHQNLRTNSLFFLALQKPPFRKKGHHVSHKSTWIFDWVSLTK